MKHQHTFFCFIALLLLLFSLSACGKSTPESTPVPEASTEAVETDAEKAQRLLDEEKYEEAYALLSSMGSDELVKESKYERAVRLYGEGDLAAASALFSGLEYKDSEQYLRRIDAAELYAALSETETGKTLCFGAYEQDGNLENGEEPIEWLVLDRQEDHVLLLSLKALDCVDFGTKGHYFVSWEDSFIRVWLNEEFYSLAFSDTEKLLIAPVDTEEEEYALTDGDESADRVFLLSETEAERCLPGDAAKQCCCTQYAIDNGSWHTPFSICRWWLRTPGDSANRKAGVRHQGSIFRGGFYTYLGYMSVRPALCIAFSD